MKCLNYFDQILEKKLYDIDREDLQNVIEGGDDRFLYNRGFIVGMGKQYYQTIYNNPSIANNKNSFYWADYKISSQSFCFFAEILFSEKYDKPMLFTGLSKETGANTEKWSN